MEKPKNEATSQSGENSDLVITPQKVDKLEVDEYLMGKALKAQESAVEAMRRKHLAHNAVREESQAQRGCKAPQTRTTK